MNWQRFCSNCNDCTCQYLIIILDGCFSYFYWSLDSSPGESFVMTDPEELSAHITWDTERWFWTKGNSSQGTKDWVRATIICVGGAQKGAVGWQYCSSAPPLTPTMLARVCSSSPAGSVRQLGVRITALPPALQQLPRVIAVIILFYTFIQDFFKIR